MAAAPAPASPRLIVGLANYGRLFADGEWGRLLDLVAAADAAGVDAVSVVDHVVLGGDLEGYPYGSFPGGVDGPWLEPLTTLAAFAGRTDRVRLLTGILIAPLRPPALLAKTAATLDQLSGGRLELGVGTGWLAKEYEALGLDFGDRGRLLDDCLDACRELWRGGTEFESPRLRFTDVHVSPRPLQEGGVPLWVGGDLHARNLERIVRSADGWIPSPPTRPSEVAAGAARLREAFAAAGRDPATLRVRVSLGPARDDDGRPDPGGTFERLPAILAETGASDVFVAHEAFSRDPAAAPALFADLVAAFRAAT